MHSLFYLTATLNLDSHQSRIEAPVSIYARKLQRDVSLHTTGRTERFSSRTSSTYPFKP